MVSQAIVPANEPQRIAAVRRYDILDTPPDGAFDRVTAIAARLFDVPISIISIVDSDRIWFKSHHGLDIQQIDREPGLCASCILGKQPHVLADAKFDPRSLANPLVAGEFGLRFYAGVPLQTSDGYNLGTLCVIDRAPRPVTQKQIDDLKDLASVVVDQMELRLSARLALAQAQLMAHEIDHRVMNSLQFISSLLILQSRAFGKTEAAGQLRQAAGRIAAIARVHRHFYSSEDQEISCLAFLRRLCADLSEVLGRTVEVSGDDGSVPAAAIQSIGLIANELVTNAGKHGRGTIEVSYKASGTTREIAVSDQGDGLPEEFDPLSSNGLGMKVVVALAEKLGGSLTAHANPVGQGARFKVTFPA